ncbi:MAG: NUDIX hydrolase [Thermoleophilaceae bacterium]|nr:NUDIX hydrolase [Thermoleophilaceae bacterium]
MGGAWVFPGGSVHAEDDGEKGAALRELREEAGLEIADTEGLVAFSRWVTPVEVKKRFDTWFFALRAPAGQDPEVDGAECVDFRWIGPQAALEAGGRGELLLVFPTIKHLEQLAELESVDHALEVAAARTVEPIQPRVVMGGDHATVLLPGEPGYDD